MKTEAISSTNEQDSEHVKNVTGDVEPLKTVQSEPVENQANNELRVSSVNENDEILDVIETKPKEESQCSLEVEDTKNEEGNNEHPETEIISVIPILEQDNAPDIFSSDNQALPVASDSTPVSQIGSESPAISLENAHEATTSTEVRDNLFIQDVAYNNYPLSPYSVSSAPPISLESEGLMADIPSIVPSIQSESSAVEEPSARPRSQVLTTRCKKVVTQNIVHTTEIEEVEELTPFTEEQLKHFYFNQELLDMDFFVDEFLKVCFIL